jgi:hypothetical protein
MVVLRNSLRSLAGTWLGASIVQARTGFCLIMSAWMLAALIVELIQ